MNLDVNDYRYPLLIAVIIHIVLMTVVFISFSFDHTFQPAAMAGSHAVPIKAVAINQRAVERQIDKINNEKRRQRELAIERKRRLAEQARQAKLARIREQQRLAKLKAQRAKMLAQEKAERAQAAAKLKALKKQQAAEKKRIAALKAQQAAERKKKIAKAKAQKDALAKQLAQQLQKEQANMANIRGKQTANIVNQYIALIKNAIEDQWLRPENVPQKLECKLLIKLAPGGSVISVSIAKSSGNSALDQSALTAAYKASPLPVPNDPQIFEQYFHQFVITT